MRRQRVVLCIENREIPAELDLDQIRYGGTVYVDLDASPPGVYLTAGQRRATAFKVGYISRGLGDRFVNLFRRARFAHDLGQLVQHTAPAAFAAGEADALIGSIARRIPFDVIHDVGAIARSPLGRIQATLDRLQLVKMLGRPTVGEQLWLHYSGLVAYLLLTCFDLLGHLEEWVDLRPWLERTQYAPERAQANIPNNASYEQAARALIAKYDELHGVGASFRRFIEHVLPLEQRRELFACVAIEEYVAAPLRDELTAPKPLGDKKKIDWLYALRNAYTHAGAYVPGGHPALTPPAFRGDDQWWVMDDKLTSSKTVRWSVRRWPEVLEECVRGGLASYVRLAAEPLVTP
jgi:hypothetical protein